MGKHELRECLTSLGHAVVNLLRLQRWPGHVRAAEWRNDIFGYLREAEAAFSPSMRERFDIDDVYADALWIAHEAKPPNRPGQPSPNVPVTLDDLLGSRMSIDAMLAKPPQLSGGRSQESRAAKPLRHPPSQAASDTIIGPVPTRAAHNTLRRAVTVRRRKVSMIDPKRDIFSRRAGGEE